MHKLRVLLALILGILLVGALTIWYRKHDDKQLVVDPIQRVWMGLQKIVTRTVTSPQETVKKTQNSPHPSIPGLNPDFSEGKIDLAVLPSLLQGKKTYGAKDPTFLLLQRCDFNSTYCVEGYESGELMAYEKQFPDILGYQFHGYPRVNDAASLLPHQAAFCAEKLTDEKTFLSYYFSIYQARGKLDEKDLITMAERLNIADFASCMQSFDTDTFVATMQQSRKLFGFKSLPANVIINTKTGKRLLIPGLYETKEVIDAIEWMKQATSN